MMVMMMAVRSGVVFKNAGIGGNRRILKWNPSEPLVSLLALENGPVQGDSLENPNTYFGRRFS